MNILALTLRICFEMIKKGTAIFFILLANIVLLAHAVIPHHHHELQICIQRTHCDDDVTHTPYSPEHNNRPDGNDHTNCVLKQAVIIPSTQSRYLKNCDKCTDTHNHDFYIISSFRYIDLLPVSQVVTYLPEFPSFFTTFVTPILGLRAPPLV